MNKKIRMSTLEQIRKVHFCGDWIHEYFHGNIDDYDEVQKYLDKYYEIALNIYNNTENKFEPD